MRKYFLSVIVIVSLGCSNNPNRADVETTKSQRYKTDFSKLSAEVIMVEDSILFSRYHIFLSASDSMFIPQVELFMKSDTFPVLVDDNAVAIVTMRKGDAKYLHSFKGDIILNVHDSTIRFPFSYPQTFLSD